MAFPNYSYGMASMGYHAPANHGKIGSYPVNGLGLGGSGMDMIHPAMNPYPPGELNRQPVSALQNFWTLYVQSHKKMTLIMIHLTQVVYS